MAKPRFLRWSDIEPEFQHVDEPDVLNRIETSQALRAALEISRPINWWGLGIEAKTLIQISSDDGIPLVWVPRREVIAQLAQAADSAARSNVLLSNEENILEDCTATLEECIDPCLDATIPLAARAFDTYRSGFYEAAMALAVSLGEPLASWASQPRVRSFDSRNHQQAWEAKLKKVSKYQMAKLEIGDAQANPYRRDIVWQALAAPIPKFFTVWHPHRNIPVPKDLSRHLVAHQPDVQHFTPRNSLVALMLVSSLLRAQQEWSEEVRASDEAGEQ